MSIITPSWRRTLWKNTTLLTWFCAGLGLILLVHPVAMAHVFYNMNYLALIITLVLAFVVFIAGWRRVKTEPKGSSLNTVVSIKIQRTGMKGFIGQLLYHKPLWQGFIFLTVLWLFGMAVISQRFSYKKPDH